MELPAQAALLTITLTKQSVTDSVFPASQLDVSNAIQQPSVKLALIAIRKSTDTVYFAKISLPDALTAHSMQVPKLPHAIIAQKDIHW